MTPKEARERAGLSKADAANKIGVRVTSITNWEEKNSIPRKSLQKEICKAYGVTEDQIDFFAKGVSFDGKEDDETVSAYDYGVGAVAPEHLPEDQHIIELEKAHDEIKALKERLSFYEESEEGEIVSLRNLIEQYEKRIAGYEEAAAVNEDRIRAQHENLEQYRERMLKKQKIIDELINNRQLLEMRITKLKAKAYDLMEEKAELLERLYGPYQEKEDIE